MNNKANLTECERADATTAYCEDCGYVDMGHVYKFPEHAVVYLKESK